MMVVTGNLIGQWAAIVLGLIYFLWKQGASSGSNHEQLDSIKDEIAGLRDALNVRVSKIEKRVFATGPASFLTSIHHDKACASYQQLLTERIAQNAGMFERSTMTMEKIADRIDKMDETRDDQRERYDTRLRAIERSIDRMDGTVTGLATIIDRRADDDKISNSSNK